jgi:hypothetical protein
MLLQCSKMGSDIFNWGELSLSNALTVQKAHLNVLIGPPLIWLQNMILRPCFEPRLLSFIGHFFRALQYVCTKHEARTLIVYGLGHTATIRPRTRGSARKLKRRARILFMRCNMGLGYL